MLLQGTLATIKRSYEKVKLVAGSNKGNNSLFVPMVIIICNGNSEIKDRLILRHEFTISVRFISGPVPARFVLRWYTLLTQSSCKANLLVNGWHRLIRNCSFCLQGEEWTWQQINSWALRLPWFSVTLCAETSLKPTQEEPSLRVLLLGWF